MLVIDFNRLIASLKDVQKEFDVVAIEGIIQGLEIIGGIDAEPVRHGRWVKENIREKSYLRLCTACGKIAYFCGTGCSYKYCPHCGAKMDGGACGG